MIQFLIGIAKIDPCLSFWNKNLVIEVRKGEFE